MGFPEWTLWGMGISIAGALIAITLSWLGQSPQMMRRLSLSGLRLDLRVRAFTGYALALLLLAIAFFLAGVPLDTSPESETLAQQDSAADAARLTDLSDSQSDAVVLSTSTPATPETGAFSGPPASGQLSEADRSTTVADEPRETRVTTTIEATRSVTATADTSPPQPSPTASLQPTETATPRPTETPFPTLTPTTIADETAVVSTSGSTLWLKRSPGGQNLVIVRDGDVVLLRPGRANQGGVLWREVATVAGVAGWLQDEFLVVPEPETGG